jgi:hypothetical protein
MKGKIGKMKGVAPKSGMPELSHAAKPQVIAAAKKRKAGGRVEGEKTEARCDRAPRKRGGKVATVGSPLSGAASVSGRL